jgi:hypothetical protein
MYMFIYMYMICVYIYEYIYLNLFLPAVKEVSKSADIKVYICVNLYICI